MHLYCKINVAGELKPSTMNFFHSRMKAFIISRHQGKIGMQVGGWAAEGLYYNASDVTSLLIHLTEFSVSGRVYYFKGTSKGKNKASLEEEEFLSTSTSCQFMHCRMKCSQ